MHVVFHRLVQQDLREALDYYDSRGGKVLGDRFFSAAKDAVERIASTPQQFHFVAKNIRRTNLKGFPYHFLYEERPTGIRILVLRHHKRNPQFGSRRKS